MLFAVNASAVAQTRTIKLDNYNNWNLPFAKNFTITQVDDATEETNVAFPTGKYNLGLNPAAFFSVIFLDTTLIELSDPITLNYTWYGENDFQINGTWVNLNFTLDYFAEDGTLLNSSMSLKTFVSPQSNMPEPGLNGFIGMAWSYYNYNYNFMHSLNGVLTGFSAKDYEFTFEQKDTDDSTSEYVGSLVFTEGD